MELETVLAPKITASFGAKTHIHDPPGVSKQCPASSLHEGSRTSYGLEIGAYLRE